MLRQRDASGRTQYQNPEGKMVSGRYIAPNFLEYLSAGLRSAGAGREAQMAGQEAQDLQTQKQSAIANALRTFGEKANPSQAGTGATNLVNDALPPEMQIGAMPKMAPRQPDMTGAYQALADSGVADLQKAGMQGFLQMPQMQAQAQAREDDRAFRSQAAIDKREAESKALSEKIAAGLASDREKREFQEKMFEREKEFQREMKKMQVQGASAQPYFQPVQTAQGVMAFNARTGRMEPILGGNGQPVVGAQFDPSLQGSLAGAKAGATTEAKSRAESKLMAPQAIAQADEAVKLVDDLLAAPGFKQAVGGSRMLGLQKIPGTSAKDFDIRLDQLKGKQFLQAFESLKGGGQITEMEGKKATDAIARMDAAGSEAEFTKAAKEFQGVIRAGADRARAAAGGAPAPAAPKARIKFDAQGNPIQ